MDIEFIDEVQPLTIVDDDAGGRASGIADPGIGMTDCTVRALALITRKPNDDPGDAYRKWYAIVVAATRRHYEERREVPPTGIEHGVPPELYDSLLQEHGFKERPDLAGQTLGVLRTDHDHFIVHQHGHACAILDGNVWDYFGPDPPYEICDPEVLEMTGEIVIARLFMPAQATTDQVSS